MLAHTATLAQIVRQKPGRINAQNRKALREDRRADVPYKDSHLAVSKANLQRGASTSHRADDNEEVDNYSTGRAPNAQGSNLFSSKAKHQGSKKEANTATK